MHITSLQNEQVKNIVKLQKRRTLIHHPPVPQGLYLIAEAIEKPANLGALLRAADGAGANGLILCEQGTDLFNPDVLRASVGTFFSLPTLEASSSEALAWCRRHGIHTLAATPQSTCWYTSVDFCGAVAVVVGSEQYGLSAQWLAEADLQVADVWAGQFAQCRHRSRDLALRSSATTSAASQRNTERLGKKSLIALGLHRSDHLDRGG